MLEGGHLEVAKVILNTNRDKATYLDARVFKSTIVESNKSNQMLGILDKVFMWAVKNNR